MIFGGASTGLAATVGSGDVRRIAQFVRTREHRLLLWLAFDIGENVQSLLALNGSDFVRQINPHTGDPEYRVRLRREILKRTRTPRSEFTLYRETVELLDEHLPTVVDGAIFRFGHRAGWKWLKRAAREANVRCQPIGMEMTWKDLRSGMACDLLRKGWSRDEINARLGHKPSSKEIDKYINFFALDRHQPKAKADEFQLRKLEDKLQQKEAREKLMLQRMTSSEEQVAFLSARVRDLTMIIQGQTCLADVQQAIAIKKGLVGSGVGLNDVN